MKTYYCKYTQDSTFSKSGWTRYTNIINIKEDRLHETVNYLLVEYNGPRPVQGVRIYESHKDDEEYEVELKRGEAYKSDTFKLSDYVTPVEPYVFNPKPTIEI